MKFKIIGVDGKQNIHTRKTTENQIIKDYQELNKFFYNLNMAGDQVKTIDFLNGSLYEFMNYGKGFLE